MSILSVTMRGGAAPWVEAVVEWSGESATWTLMETESNTTLYTGPALRYDMATFPETIYRMRLSDDTNNSVDFAYVAPPISAPVELVAANIYDDSALLTWMEVKQADQYEVVVDGVSHNVLPPPPPEPGEVPEQPSLALGDLTPDRTYAVQARAYMDTKSSLLSPTLYFTTDRTYDAAEASLYEYEPSVARVWNSRGWLPEWGTLIHGDGFMWGNLDGIHTTVFLYSAESLQSMRELQGVRVLSAQISVTRYIGQSDPRMVLSHWMLHNMTAIPPGAPVFVEPAMGIDSGSVALGEQSWQPIPTGWITEIITETSPDSGVYRAAGFGWGGVAGRYMLAQNLIDPTRPMNGTLRITVG